jgi:hypothetical protein
MENEKWKIQNGKWKMKNEKWKICITWGVLSK